MMKVFLLLNYEKKTKKKCAEWKIIYWNKFFKNNKKNKKTKKCEKKLWNDWIASEKEEEDK